MVIFAGLLAVAFVTGSALALDLPTSSLPIPTTSSILDPITGTPTPPPTSSVALPTTSLPNTANIVPTTGEGQSNGGNGLPTPTPTPTPSPSASPSPTPTTTRSTSTEGSDVSNKPGYGGGFYTKGTDGKGSVVTIPGAQAGPLGAVGNPLGGGEDAPGAAEGNVSSDPGTEPQSGPASEYATVPGLGVFAAGAGIGAVAFVLARRRLQ